MSYSQSNQDLFSITCLKNKTNGSFVEIGSNHPITHNNFPNNIDYLQIDLDVNNRSTLDTLEIFDKTVFDNYTFATITFEHDIYSGNYFDTQEISRKIFQKRGYELLFPNVKVFWEGKYQPFEDWYVHPKLVDTQIIDKLKTNESLNSDQIKNILQSIHF